MTNKQDRFYILAEVTYLDRKNDKDFDTHWQLLKGGRHERFENDDRDSIIIAITVWHQLNENPMRDQSHWNSLDEAVDYLKQFCERVC